MIGIVLYMNIFFNLKYWIQFSRSEYTFIFHQLCTDRNSPFLLSFTMILFYYDFVLPWLCCTMIFFSRVTVICS